MKYLWMKYVHGASLGVHCAPCLKGPYSKAFGAARGSEAFVNAVLGTGAGLTTRLPVELVEHPYRFLYLCGVSKPYVWDKNFHLAMRHAPGSILEVERQGVVIRVENVEEVIIVDRGTYDHPKANDRTFVTCRNWQFAYDQVAKGAL